MDSWSWAQHLWPELELAGPVPSDEFHWLQLPGVGTIREAVATPGIGATPTVVSYILVCIDVASALVICQS